MTFLSYEEVLEFIRKARVEIGWEETNGSTSVKGKGLRFQRDDYKETNGFASVKANNEAPSPDAQGSNALPKTLVDGRP
ncbi:hypothetical protein F0562_015262 [Nyssa sinensis]|uniref:Uncharacterized protein n=1 Tax=Nyssa sinensis TaxID=561372 RepID=A0A5J4ZKG0_9ASTE|nr:hypothetical protein F0562_015262 [Nyssa sinensis]